MSYYKRVIYMDYRERGEKVSNAGFVKLLKLKKDGGGFAEKWEEQQKERVCMQIHVQNLPGSIDCEGNAKLVKDGREILLGAVGIRDGRGLYQIKDVTEYCEDWETYSLKIEVMPAGIVWCELGEKMPKEHESDAESVGLTGNITDIGVTEDKGNAAGVGLAEDEGNAAGIALTRNEGSAEEQMATERVREVTRMPAPEPEKHTLRGLKKMHRDKWKQLWEMLPHICPFEDEREYLQLDLRDLLVLSGRYYRLVENSFLLHGYYNYEHLILAMTWRRGAEKYYLGVPGNYYEREKQVAAWFGFESFEPRTEPASEGDFGYYMISVEL